MGFDLKLQCEYKGEQEKMAVAEIFVFLSHSVDYHHSNFQFCHTQFYCSRFPPHPYLRLFLKEKPCAVRSLGGGGRGGKGRKVKKSFP